MGVIRRRSNIKDNPARRLLLVDKEGTMPIGVHPKFCAQVLLVRQRSHLVHPAGRRPSHNMANVSNSTSPTISVVVYFVVFVAAAVLRSYNLIALEKRRVDALGPES